MSDENIMETIIGNIFCADAQDGPPSFLYLLLLLYQTSLSSRLAPTNSSYTLVDVNIRLHEKPNWIKSYHEDAVISWWLLS